MEFIPNAIKEEEKRLAERRKAIENRIDNIKDRITKILIQTKKE
jgi:hypothetical protein